MMETCDEEHEVTSGQAQEQIVGGRSRSQGGQVQSTVVELQQRVVQLEQQLEQEKRQTASQLIEKEEELQRLRKEMSRIDRQRQNVERALSEKEQSLNEYLHALDIQPSQLQINGKQLGSGSFGTVQVGCWCGVPVAVKTFHEALRLPQLAPVFMSELSICSQLHYPNIVPIYGAVMVDGIPIQLVMELLQGSVSDLMKAARASTKYLRYLSFREQIDVATGTVAGIMYMHCLRPEPYLHCDIRATNVMITGDMIAKVGDLGASHVINSVTSLGALSPEYVAPEKFPRADGTSARSTINSDIYSLGVTLTELFTGLAPIPLQRQSQLHRISNDYLMDMCLQMTSDNPDERPPAQECFDILVTQKAADLYVMLPGRRIVRGNLEGEDMSIIDFEQV